MTLEQLTARYEAKTPASKAMHQKACKSLPGGIAANVKFYDPYPLFMQRGEGAWLTDVDGNRYVDYLLSYGPLELGHGHPAVTDAIKRQFEEHGTLLYGTPHEMEAVFAETIKRHYPSMDLVRYANSGTEAVLLALRIAYAYTGKYKIGKFEGHYHGGLNQVLFSVNPPMAEAGDAARPKAVPDSSGLEPHQYENTVILPFNDLDACRAILGEHREEMAAVIMEPILTGYILPDPSFMTGLRALTEELGILLIYDEVKTGFRAGLGGAQGLFGIKPDLTAMGKVIGAGIPMGLVGGKREIMEIAAPVSGSDVFDLSTGRSSTAREVLFHSGTYNGHPLILAAGLATIEVLEREFPALEERTGRLRADLEALFREKGIPMQTVGVGSVFNLAITGQSEIHTYRDMQRCDLALRKRLDFALLVEGVYNKPTNRYSLSTAHGDAEISFTLQAFRNALQMV